MSGQVDTGHPDGLVLRRAVEGDRPAVIELCRASLGWVDGDPNEAFFTWKHDENPFGASPAWVAESPDGMIVGLRVFLRWRFYDAAGTALSAVRAVDTATHPGWQGKGIFTKLTLSAIPDLRDDGVDLIFNTPNDKSRPGYLKMGWSEVGRVPVGVRFGSLGSVRSMRGARTAAAMWSEAATIGDPASEVLADTAGLELLLDAVGRSDRIETDRTAAYLQWRYGFEPLRYRAVLVGTSLDEGVVILRVRRRGTALEGAICEVLVPGRATARGVMRRIARESGADYLLRCAPVSAVRDGYVPAAGLGPILTWRPIERFGVPQMRDLDLGLGDIELF